MTGGGFSLLQGSELCSVYPLVASISGNPSDGRPRSSFDSAAVVLVSPPPVGQLCSLDPTAASLCHRSDTCHTEWNIRPRESCWTSRLLPWPSRC